jgi:hypothetical protein
LKKDPSQPLKFTISSEQVELQKKAKEFLKQKSAEEEDAPSMYCAIFKYRVLEGHNSLMFAICHKVIKYDSMCFLKRKVGNRVL